MITIWYTTNITVHSNDLTMLYTLRNTFQYVEIKADKQFDIAIRRRDPNDDYYDILWLANDEFFEESEYISVWVSFDKLIEMLHLYLTDCDEFVSQYIPNLPSHD